MVGGLVEQQDVRWLPEDQRESEPRLLASRQSGEGLHGQPTRQTELGEESAAFLLLERVADHHVVDGGGAGHGLLEDAVDVVLVVVADTEVVVT
eukprot:scaffold542598_cov33-Prasinocladus_malaysianus.AAC.1